MDKLLKSLQKLTKKESEQIDKILAKIETDRTSGLNIKKLKGRNDIYRARKGRLRIIYQKKGDNIILVMISRRNKGMYEKL
ncbi:MAG: hypothetical protein KAS07_03190 [Candidatus Pacebacteria bacterium]|nr:hypothetical protein [Candidatus Paceibacterota bacterium]